MSKIVHYVKATPESQPVEERGLYCGASFGTKLVWTSNRDNVTCKNCLRVASPKVMPRLPVEPLLKANDNE